MTAECSTKEILNGIVKCSISTIEVLGEGFGGTVYKVDTDKGKFIVKFIKKNELFSPETEPVNERVFGSRWSEFLPVYALLKNNHLPVPTLHATGATPNGAFQYFVMDFIEGVTVHEYLKFKDKESNELHKIVGGTLGRLHAIQKDYQGWVSMHKSYKKPWGEAFFEALENQILEIEEESFLPEKTIVKIRNYIDTYRNKWIEPTFFVLSHLDGFQGIASQASGKWSIEAIIDIEDYQYTDQRFVLAGYELNLESEGRTVPNIFWNAYKLETKIDDTFFDFKNLFKLYYLSVWLCVFKDNTMGVVVDRESKADNSARMIGKLVNLK